MKSYFKQLDLAIRLYESGLTQEQVAKKLGVTKRIIQLAFNKARYKARIPSPTSNDIRYKT